MLRARDPGEATRWWWLATKIVNSETSSARSRPRSREVAAALLRHFRRTARDFPWRSTRDPYAIWVSEIMLQQTRATSVIPYFRRWMAVLPDVQTLASSSESRVLDLWAGLGYYRRPRHLRRAAQLLVREGDGAMPSSLEGWLSLPGVGRYTAGAICSIAYNQPVPIVDGNVHRVLSRVWTLPGPAHSARHRNRLWALARELVHHAHRSAAPRGRRNCADLNQALMELGATICTAREPACLGCPLARFCLANQRGSVARYPQRRPRAKPIRRGLRVLVIRRSGRFFVRRGAAEGWNARLWEFPTEETPMTQERVIGKSRSERTARNGSLFQLTHSITRNRFTVLVTLVKRPPDPRAQQGQGRWLRLDQMRAWPFAGLHRKVALRLVETFSSRALKRRQACAKRSSDSVR